MHIEEARTPLWHRLRRPSTLLLLGAGLLAADRLRRLDQPWTDATPWLLGGLAVALSSLLLLRARRPARRVRSREIVAVLPSMAAKPLCDPTLARPAQREGLLRYRIFLFAIVVLALLTLPALVARGVAP